MTAARLVQHHGDSVMEVLDGKGAAAALARVSGIGATQASRIKLAWDASRGALLGLLKRPCLWLHAAQRHQRHCAVTACVYHGASACCPPTSRFNMPVTGLSSQASPCIWYSSHRIIILCG